MRSRTIAAIGAVLLGLTLTACSSDDGDSKGDRTPVNPAVTQPPGPASAPPAGALGRPVVISGAGLEVTTTVERIPVYTGALASTPDGQVNAGLLKDGASPVRVRIAVSNRGVAPFDLSGLFVREFAGATSGGVASYTDWSSVREEKLAGLVAPGSSGTGTVSYAVPPRVADGFRITIAVQRGSAGALPDLVVTGRLDSSGA
ncbi:hypothetical protein [Embleya sp. NPDC059237]|uniref:hypothetical protein n=1 Tax=Embleya sp. NPDC059237 TaxID=3346784 RepID=UPI0036A99546